VTQIAAREPLLAMDWPGDQKSGIRCVVEQLEELKWKPEMGEPGPTVQIVWNGPSLVFTKKPIAIFEVTGATATKPGRIVMRAVDMDEPDRVRQSWRSKIASCSP